MMQSAPISRAAATVFSRCCATSVSTVGTPVMSMIAIRRPVSTMRCSRLSITTWVRALSSVPISGSARMPSHSCTTGVDSSSISCCCRAMTSSRRLLVRPRSCRGRACRAACVAVQISSASARGVARQLLAQPREQRLLQREHERRGLRRREPLPGPRRRDRGQELADRRPRGAVGRLGAGPRGRVPDEPQELRGLLSQLVVLDEIAPAGRRPQLQIHPGVEQILLVTLENLDEKTLSGRAHGNPFPFLNCRTHNDLLRGRRAETSWSGAPEDAGPSRPEPRARWAPSDTRRHRRPSRAD